MKGVSLAWFTEGGLPQASRVTLTKFCRYNDPVGDDLACNVRLLVAGSLENVAQHCDHFWLERPRLYE
jgi:hypothetical protein